MSFYKEVPGRKTTLESTLKFDTTPTAGSTNPVTSDGVATAITEAVGGASDALQEQIDDIAEKAGSGYTPKGPASVATLNGLTGQENGWLYTMTDAGTLTEGSLAVVAGDTVAWDATNEVWYKAMDYAPRRYGTNEVHNLSTSITAFRTGDVIPVDGPSGTAKMLKDDLLRATAENALGSIHLLSDTATEADLVSGNYLALDGSAGTKKLKAEDVAKRSVQDNLNRQCNTDYSKTLTNVSVTQGVAHSSLSELFNDESNPLKKGTKLSITYTPSPAGILEGCGFYGLTTSNTQVWFGDFTTKAEMLLPYDLKKFGMAWSGTQAKASGTFSIDIVADTSIATRVSNCEQSIVTLNNEMKPVNADYTKTASLSVTQNTSYSSTSLLFNDAANPLKKGTKLTISYTPSVEGLLENAGFYGVTTSDTQVWFGVFTTQTELYLPYDLKRFGVDWSASQAKATGTASLSVTAATSLASRLEIVEEKVDELQADVLFKNPIFTTYNIGDPAVFDGGDGWFYCFQTSAISSNSANRKMIRSTNLVDWEESDDPISDETRSIIAGMSDATNFYAPHIIKIGEFFNMYISLQNKAMIVLRSKFPNGFYEFVGDPYVLVGPDNTPVGNSYEDSFVVRDRDGQLWLFYGSHGNIVRRKLDPDGLHVADDEETHVAGIIGEVGVDNPGEGPTLYRKGGYWWLFYARGNWMNNTYCEYVGRSETLGGTFVNKNGQPLTEAVGELVLDKKGIPYRGAAHIGDIIVDRENHYFVNVPSYNPNLETGSRSLCLTEIKWGDDGWPEYHGLSFNSQKRPIF